MGLHVYRESFMMVVQTHVGALCLIRVYALYGRSLLILGFLAFIGLMSVVTAVGAFLAGHHAGGNAILVSSGLVGCSNFVPLAEGRFGAIAWITVSVFDSVIFSLTLYKAFKIGRGVRLLNVIVRDGAMYFLVLLIMNLSNIFTLLYSPVRDAVMYCAATTATLTNVFSAILASRLVFNLREQNSTLVHLPPTIETERRFQAALPFVQQSMRSLNSTYEILTDAIGATGASHSSQTADSARCENASDSEKGDGLRRSTGSSSPSRLRLTT
ncbi:hypothetical protein BC827DRAFT_194561 [Russula dissimulans]|nr:hypothetical protein BC827DRAFT_194561 [Russula dissimulans]